MQGGSWILRIVLKPEEIPDSKVHGAYMGLTWGRQDPGGPHVGPMNFAIRDWTLSCKMQNSHEFSPNNIYITCIKLQLMLFPDDCVDHKSIIGQVMSRCQAITWINEDTFHWRIYAIARPQKIYTCICIYKYIYVCVCVCVFSLRDKLIITFQEPTGR